MKLFPLGNGNISHSSCSYVEFGSGAWRGAPHQLSPAEVEWGRGAGRAGTAPGRWTPRAQVAEGLRLAWSPARAYPRAPPRGASPPTSSAGAAAVREPGARRTVQARGTRKEAAAWASCPAAPHPAPAAAPHAMDLPRGLLVAWALSLWPGTLPPCLRVPVGAPRRVGAWPPGWGTGVPQKVAAV